MVRRVGGHAPLLPALCRFHRVDGSSERPSRAGLWQAALCEVLSRLNHGGLTWWLYGSAALAIRGIELDPGDIDIKVSECNLTGKRHEAASRFVANDGQRRRWRSSAPLP